MRYCERCSDPLPDDAAWNARWCRACRAKVKAERRKGKAHTPPAVIEGEQTQKQREVAYAREHGISWAEAKRRLAGVEKASRDDLPTA